MLIFSGYAQIEHVPNTGWFQVQESK
jgi:hypothetical protein